MTDAELVLLARRGDQAAARALYDAHAPAVHGYCLAFCRGDAASAADLTQDSFVAAFTSLEQLADPAAFGGWLRVIARRRCLRWIDGRKREEAALKERPEPDGPDEAAERLARRVLEECPDPALRRTASLFYGDPPRSTGEIAAELGLSVTAVTTRLHRFRTWARVQALRHIQGDR